MDTDYNMLWSIVLNKKNSLFCKTGIMADYLYLGKKEIFILINKFNVNSIEIGSISGVFFGMKIIEVRLDSFVEVGEYNECK